ncbi:MAG: ATP-binding cassette domain-containing protein [Microbacteriaceae bacterium]|nr:ATP-binding cassette domain-containing protein [Microbacteriaceae bacterium]
MIEFRSVTKRFGDGTVAIEDFSLVVPSRRTTVLVGSSGSGKTTLLRMINRMIDPTSGGIEIDGEDTSTLEPVKLRRRIGYVMQNSGLLPHLKVIDNIATVPILNGVKRALAREQALELLDTVGLDRSLAERYPNQLSGGQQQRVGVARGLAADPNILLMDEPFGAVDPIVRDELQRELIRLQRELGKTVVFVTHDIDEAFLLGDQVVILETGGRVAQVGSPSEIMQSPANEFVASFIGTERGKRALSIRRTARGRVLVDGAGRTAGVLVDEPATTGHDVDSAANSGADSVAQVTVAQDLGADATTGAVLDAAAGPSNEPSGLLAAEPIVR